MSSYVERGFWLALILACFGCPDSHLCDSAELCNGRDDDCDGKQDEGFVDARGRYIADDHCGRCSVACDEVFPSASATSCDTRPDVPICAITACELGFHRAGAGACVPDDYVLCLPCSADSECGARTPGARCLELGGERRCGIGCSASAPCPTPFVCDTTLGQCLPDTGLCACDRVDATFEVACLGEGIASDLVCAGLQTCTPTGLTECAIKSSESCNLLDDNCDGKVDEDFRDAEGRYIDRLHCGGCGLICAAPGVNYRADCVPEGDSARCLVACEEGFVDVDGIEGNGCECQRFDDVTAPRAVGGDADCDGVIDDNDLFIHVTSAGSDSALGTLVAPLRTLDVAIARAKAEDKLVLVAQGSYPPFDVVGGVRVFGGYRSDFLDRDPERYPVLIEAGGALDGAAVLTCSEVTEATLIDGFTLVGQDALTPGQGSTAALFDRCGPQVKLAHVNIVAGRGADGERGQDASARLPAGFSSLSDLDGSAGTQGREGDGDGQVCTPQAGGAGGPKLCAGTDVSGGGGGASTCGGTGCRNGQACANAGCSDFTVAGVCDYERVLALAVANPQAQAGRGSRAGAAGARTYNAPTSRGVCSFCDDNPSLERLGQDGGDGRAGERGPGGAGCADAPLSFDAAGRASASRGSAGVAGSHGSGGGGGSAGAGYDVITGTRIDDSDSCDDNAGGSGAGAGSGGCGAPGGGGGGGGGASIGVVVRATTAGTGPSFEAVRVVTASGGRGGDGGIGAAGGVGGAGALGGSVRFWCARNGGRGGDGGPGGAGGGGGGGCGGSSHALVFRGTVAASYRTATSEALSVAQAGVAGQGGEGGFSPGFSGSEGEPGATTALR